MPVGSASTSLSITNPLVLYRALIATRKIKPDPAQHRLALHLQKLYFRLKDYTPELEYRYRLDQIIRTIPTAQDVAQQRQQVSDPPSGFLSSILRDNSGKSMLALTRTIPIHDSALNIDSPQGMLLYGEVGRGKSMLLDLLYSSLPSTKKRRWHFNTFMLDIFRRIEQIRVQRMSRLGVDHEHVVLSLAKDTVSTSPILFLDEFQMPDRTSSKLLNSFMTAFFHLGGVLVASSNRMPDELAKASGIEFNNSRKSSRSIFGWSLARTSEGQKAAQSDFGQFLEVLKARCEVWEMEGERDWRRDDGMSNTATIESLAEMELEPEEDFTTLTDSVAIETTEDESLSSDAPPHYHVTLPSDLPSALEPFSNDLTKLNPDQNWSPATVHVYGRNIHIPNTHFGTAMCTFAALCNTNLGPADYTSLCSTFHTLILTDVPVLTFLQKNEARRFITLLDALYEARCRLLISAAAPPDKLFFPEIRSRTATDADGNSITIDESGDSITSEAFSEMYQDSTAPFRPNISLYTESNNATSTPTSTSTPISTQPTQPSSNSTPSYTQSLLNPSLRSVLADEDADFGPTYGNGRSQGMSTMSGGPEGMAELEQRQGPDFTNTSALTGEDERFAYKRARSRLWEMCGRRWWRDRENVDVEEWWTPVSSEGRFWEKSDQRGQPVGNTVEKNGTATNTTTATNNMSGGEKMRQGSHDGSDRKLDSDRDGNEKDQALFRHGASPFRTTTDPPPKFGWQHAWGMMQWGKKAGEWGKGVDGDRKRNKTDQENEK